MSLVARLAIFFAIIISLAYILYKVLHSYSEGLLKVGRNNVLFFHKSFDYSDKLFVEFQMTNNTGCVERKFNELMLIDFPRDVVLTKRGKIV